jgi:DNA repair protein RecO (recombination protein O)
MSFLKTEGIVVKEVSTGEADKIITLFTREQGRVSAFVKGGRRPRSRLSAASQILCYGDFILYKGRELYSVNSCDVIEPFYEIRNDMVKLTYAAHFTDIVLETVQESQPSPKLLKLLLNSLHMLAKTDKPPDLIDCIFELRAVSISGYAPHVQACMNCGAAPEKYYSFSFRNCGFLCDRSGCLEHDGAAVPLSVGASGAIQHIVYAPMKELFRFGLSREVLDELSRITGRYLRERLEREFNKLEFVKKVW